MRALVFLISSKRMMKKYEKSGQTVVTLFQEKVKLHPDKIAFAMVDGRQWTFREIDEHSNAIANYYHDNGFRKGDVVALFMESRPEFVCYWLAMTKIGAVAALINFNLRMESLAHCIKVSEAKALIFGGELTEAVSEIKSSLPGGQLYFSTGDPYKPDVFQSINIDPLIASASNMPPPKDFTVTFNEKLFYIFTSGTTGLPKAAIVIHSRFFYMAYSTHHFFKMNTDDVIYDTLPLYHSAGGILGVGQTLLMGCTLVVRKKFSASNFWNDCIKYNCTGAQYIGEICRYLLAQPNKPTDKQHRVRFAYGNGLRPQIWEEFMSRYGIERIGEFYGATEGNANIINPDNTVGAVGFTTRIAPALYPVTLIKIDKETGVPVRDRFGLCVKCEPGEPGELVGKIVKGDPLREFDGYVNKDATTKKVCYDVFKKGDCAFLTGDVLVMDEFGYMFFRDRTGDTFRWRGENVSTSEVEATVSNIVKLNDAVAYGVEIPGVEGRAGMVAIVDENNSLDLKQLYRDLQKALPAYARPVFVRVLENVDLTGTFKLKKTEYRKESFNPSQTSDNMYFLDSKAGEYRLIDEEVYNQICSGKIRF